MCFSVFFCPQLHPSLPPFFTNPLGDNVTGCQSCQGLGCIGDERVFGRTLLWATPGRRQQREAEYRRNQPYHSQVSHGPSSSSSCSSSIFSLWPLNSSNQACGLNSDPWNRDPCACPMQTKCTTIPEETLSLASSNRSKYPFLLSTQGPVSYTRLAGCCHSATPSCDLLW